jgi:hypothetical protein
VELANMEGRLYTSFSNYYSPGREKNCHCERVFLDLKKFNPFEVI